MEFAFDLKSNNENLLDNYFFNDGSNVGDVFKPTPTRSRRVTITEIVDGNVDWDKLDNGGKYPAANKKISSKISSSPKLFSKSTSEVRLNFNQSILLPSDWLNFCKHEIIFVIGLEEGCLELHSDRKHCLNSAVTGSNLGIS